MRLGWIALWLGVVALALASSGGRFAAARQQDGTVTLTVHYRICNEVPADGDYYTACHDNPVSDGYIAVYSDVMPNAPTAEGTTDSAGNITFSLFAGTYMLIGAPGDFLDASAIFCARNSALGESIGHPVTVGTGDQVTCDYYIVPSCNDADGDCTPEPSAPPTDNGTSGGPQPVTTLPSTGSGTATNAATSGGSWLLAGAGLSLATLCFRLRRRSG